MNADLLDPESVYKYELKDKHHERVIKYVEDLTKRSGVDVEANRMTCDKLYLVRREIKTLEGKLGRSKFLQILFIVMIILGAFFGLIGGIVISNGDGLVGGLMLGGGIAALIGGILLLVLVYKKKAKALNKVLDEKKKKLANSKLKQKTK